MKKTYFKKAMSTFMAVIMLLSCWVWIAPERAEAVAGSYYVKISYTVTDDADDYNKPYTGKASGTDNNVGISLFYKTNNGTGTEYEKYWDMQSNMATKHSDAVTGTISGFPTSIYVYNNNGGLFDAGVLQITKIEIGSSSTSTLRTLWIGTISVDSTMNAAIASMDSSYNPSVSDDAYVSTTTKNWVYPYADENSITWSNTPEAMTCPETGTATQQVAVSAKDQYGVQMFDPTWTVTGSDCKDKGISITSGSVETATISLTNAANVNGTTNVQTGTVTASWAGVGTTKTSSKTFNINDTLYDVVFTQHADANGVIQTDVKEKYRHGMTPVAPAAYSYQDGDYDVTFNGWSPSVGPITSKTTYTAVYVRSDKILADYTEVDKAIEAANTIKAQYGTEYEFKYTYASRTALDTAINNVVRGLGRTRQNDVDGYAQAINEAIAALAPNTFDVIFLDRNGAILLYEKDAEYKDSVTAPELPDEQKMYSDPTNHYTYTDWDTDEYESVVDDLVINPVYMAEPHNFTTETVPSTCIQEGATKHTCTVCGYSYIDGETTLGDHMWESDFTTDLEPTCTVAGQKSIHCSLCDAQKDITVIDPLGHNWSSQSVAVEATCGKIGIMAKVCDDCGVCEHTIIPALEHDYKETVVAPTCTTKGYTEYACQRAGCGHKYTGNFTDITEHKYGNWETVAEARCGVAGTKKRVCEDCGYTELDSIDPLSHDTPEWVTVVDATCEGKGYRTKTCSKCGNVIASEVILALTHNYVVEKVVAPTCTAGGYTVKKCDRTNCGAQIITDETAALGHDWTTTEHDADCTHSAYIEYICGNDESHNYLEYVAGSTATGHNFKGAETVVTAATCTTDGEKAVQCTNCAETTKVIIPRLGHKWTEWVKVDATNEDDGSWTRTCPTCDTTETLEIPAGGHNLVEDTTAYIAPTCESKGLKVYKCNAHEYCTVKVEVELDVIQHVVTTRQTESTCRTQGTVEAYCSVCQKVFKTETTPVKAHNFAPGTPVGATCTESGYIPYICSVCDFTYNVINADDAAKGHSWNDGEETSAATCEKDGTMKYTCTVDGCGETKTETIAKLGHSWGEWTVTKNPTANEEGKKERTCSRGCSEEVTLPKLGHDMTLDAAQSTPATCVTDGTDVYVCTTHTGTSACGYTLSITVPATGHKWNDGEVTTAAKCDTDGVKTYTCTADGCGETKTETIAALGHDLTTIVTDAECGEKGSVVTTCSRCTYKKITELAAKGHIWGTTPTETVDATCETEGSKTYKCENCAETNTVIVPATGHDWNDWVVVPSTNDAPGSITRTCKNNPNHKETVEIPAGGHNLVEDTNQYVAPDCDTEGTKVYVCENHKDCNISVTVTVPVKQHTVKTEKQDATCENAGYIRTYCEDCKKVFSNETTKAIAHTYVKGDAEEPTCTTSGYTPYTCACGDTYNEYDSTKPATGHKFKEGASTATCTNEGLMTLTCENCTHSEKVKVPALGHNYEKVESASTEATCAGAATETYKCTLCNDSYKVSVGGKTDSHEYEGWKVVVSATESSIGYQTNTCKICGKTLVETIEATGEHKFTDGKVVDSKDATCTEDGFETYACSVHDSCGKTSTVTFKATGHTEELQYTSADCENAGSTKIVCSVCDEEIDSKEIDALGHAWGKGVVTNSTCKEKGKIEYSCTRCTATHETEIATNANAHNYVTTVVDSTCTTAGTVVTQCNLCGDISTNKTLAIKVHTFTGEEKVIKQATCTEDGSKTVKCENCEATTTVVLTKTGHTWGAWTVTKASTNTEEGELTRTCETDAEHKETVKFPAGGHNLVESGKTDATCTAEGSVTYDCDVHKDANDCGISVTVTLAKTQHILETTKTDATCEGEGSVVTKCKNCNTATIETVIPATGHTYDDGAVESPATCETEGKIVYTCTAKDCTKTKEVVLTKLQHNYIEQKVVDATCTESGYISYKCATCESAYKDVTTPANGHKFTEKVSSTADCTTAGVMTLKCENCEVTMTTEVPALGHNYEKVENASTAATCAAAATETYECSRCNDSYKVSVGSKTEDHEWNDWETVVQATYTSIGYKTRTCKVCDKMEVETIQKSGDHNLVEVDRQEPTCDEDGYIKYDCDVHKDENDCGEEDVVTLPATGHTEELQYKAATCTEEGYAKTVCTVDECKKEIESETIPALGHSWGKEQITLSTCTVNGKVEFTCMRAGCDEKHTVVLPLNENAHSTTTATKPASCKEEGSVITSCTLCGEELVNTTLSKLQHVWSEWTVTKDATNEEDGVMTRTCNGGCTETVVIPKGGHKFDTVPTSTVPASCTATGTAIYKCTAHADCGVEITVTLPKIQHTIKTESDKASCTKEGYVKSYCTVCGEKFADITIEKLAHEFEAITIDATCEGKGSVTYNCKYCDETKTVELDAKGHNLTVETVDATCTEDGYVKVTCSRCDYEEITPIKKKGHTWGDTPVASTDATCETDGSATYQCVNCTEEKTVTIAKLGHIYKETETVDPTCITSGYTIYVCEHNPDHTYNVYDADKKATGHSFGEWNVVTYATETTDGLKERTCTVCGEKDEDVIPAMKHEIVEIDRVDASCAQEGYVIYGCGVDHDGVKCSYTITVELEKLPHTLKTEVEDAKCDTDGKVITSCTECDGVNIETVLSATGHAWDKGTVTKEASCTEQGLITYVCAHDSNHSYTQIVEKLQHNFVEGEEVEATCTESGYIPYDCADCDESYVEITDPATGHNYIKDENSSTATCLAGGTVTFECACGAEMIADVPALGHNYVKNESASTNATCADAATETYECSRCDAAYTITVGDKTDEHVWGEWQVKETPTEVSLGYETRECELCGKVEVRTLPATGEHEFTIYVPEDSKAPGCEEVGYEVYRCSAHTDCTATSKVEIPATGHTEKQNYIAPDCENEGATQVVCDVCGEELQSTPIAALGHAWADGTITKQPTCFGEGEITYTCSRDNCGETKTETVQPTGHIWDNGKIIKESTCLEKGEKLYTCTGEDCGETYIKVLNEFGHSYERVVTPATCTEQGYTTYTCRNCGDSYKDSYTEPVGHSIGEWYVQEDATCEEDGLRRRDCSGCNLFETEVIPATGHRWGEWELIGGEICAEGAIRARECLVCGALDKDMLEDGEHTYRTDENGDIIFDNIFEPGCEHEGFYIYRCIICDTEVKFTAATPGYEEELAATGHNWQKDENGDIVYVQTKSVTCFKDGEHYRTCTNDYCKLDQHREYLVIPTVGHQLKAMSGSEATCDTAGYSDYYQCVVCGYDHNKVVYPAMGHADEDEDGKCDNCADVIDVDSTVDSKECSCMCHESGFMGFIYKIIRFFWKLFGINKNCECGEAHY